MVEHINNLTIRDLNISSNGHGLIAKTGKGVISETIISNNTYGLELWGVM